ncbi:MAG TPA: hypothetical protein VGE69_16000 [Pseudomonadales bacterium]
MQTGTFVPRSLALVRASLCACGLAAILLPMPVAAQDSAFLACERFSDRGQRIACLEDALEAATAQDAVPSQPASPAASSQPAQSNVAPAATSEAPAASNAAPAASNQEPAATNQEPVASTEEASLLDRLRNFGRDDDGATLSTDDSGHDRLHDTIASLEKRRDAWIVTLASGQVWMQDYPRELALREGDTVTIYRAGFGNGYRLSTDRLSGFIRVKRVR